MTKSNDWPDFTFAYQPIVDVQAGKITSFEALVRGPENQHATAVLENVNQSARYLFDELLRCRAIELAHQLGINCRLNLNLMPKALAMLDTAIESALEAADEIGFGRDLITLEVTEADIIDNVDWFAHCVRRYRAEGVKFAIDDFGKVYAGFNLIASFMPDSIKVDHNLIRDIEQHKTQQSVVESLSLLCKNLDIDLVAEGVETQAEFDTCAKLGIKLFQGYLFSRPGFESLPTVDCDQVVRVA